MLGHMHRVCIRCQTVQASISGFAARQASTTSSIKSGLRAESAGRASSRTGFSSRFRIDNSDVRKSERPLGYSNSGRSGRNSDHHAIDRPRKVLNEEQQWRKDGQDGFRNRRERRKEWFSQHQAQQRPHETDDFDPRDDEVFQPRGRDRSSFASVDRATSRNRHEERLAPTPRRHSENNGTQRQRPSIQSRHEEDPQPRKRTRSAQADHDDIPMPVHYTTASSQFVYGANVVLAALQAQSRKLYRLYMHKRAEAGNIAVIRRAAAALNVEITRTADTALLDQLSEGRPHNGVVLEVSPIPARPVKHLGPFYEDNGLFKLTLHSQSAEEAAVNGLETTMRGFKDRKPLILFLDGITDPGNVGNIIRSAHFFGADAVAIATQTCAPITSPVLAKASAGACEAIPIFAVSHASEFVFSSRKAGWTICAAVAPADIHSDNQTGTKKHLTTRELTEAALTHEPTILVLGAEGQGLRTSLLKKAEALVTIEHGLQPSKFVDSGVDSLNVATAAAVLLNAFVLGRRHGSNAASEHGLPVTGDDKTGEFDSRNVAVQPESLGTGPDVLEEAEPASSQQNIHEPRLHRLSVDVAQPKDSYDREASVVTKEKESLGF